jgi:hypothetical protein
MTRDDILEQAAQAIIDSNGGTRNDAGGPCVCIFCDGLREAARVVRKLKEP